MEANVWTDPAVLPIIRDSYVLIQLYVDDKTKYNDQSATTIGAANSLLQTSRFNSNSQPFYVLLDPTTEKPLVNPQGADYDVASYLKYLNSGLAAFH
jgi:thiol:disulfide interchange protein DsbD